MRAINHALTGTFIGLIVHEPIIAIPAAIASHFVCDAIPHYDGVQQGIKNKQQWMRSRKFRNLLYADMTLCAGLVLVLAVKHPLSWQLAVICAFLATSPDFLWMKRYRSRHAKQTAPLTGFHKFAGEIQWFQRPIGAVVEVTWFICGLIVLATFVH